MLVNIRGGGGEGQGECRGFEGEKGLIDLIGANKFVRHPKRELQGEKICAAQENSAPVALGAERGKMTAADIEGQMRGEGWGRTGKVLCIKARCRPFSRRPPRTGRQSTLVPSANDVTKTPRKRFIDEIRRQKSPLTPNTPTKTERVAKKDQMFTRGSRQRLRFQKWSPQ